MENNLKELRKSAHLTQGKLGQAVGLSQQVISRIEGDTETMTLEQLILLSDFFSVSTDYILGRSLVKRGPEWEHFVVKTLEDNFYMVQAIKRLGERDRALLWALLDKMLEKSEEES